MSRRNWTLGQASRDVGGRDRPWVHRPPKFERDPAVVWPGEILDVCTGKPEGPHFIVDGICFVPRRNGESRYQTLSMTLARARVRCE
jgi:hypothetical protein